MLPGNIITNGYLLNEDAAHLLNKIGINRAQITLDGSRDIHNQRRFLKGGGGTFDRILDNIVKTCDILDLQIRINIDRDNAKLAKDVLDEFETRDLQKRIQIYFGHVKPFTSTCAIVNSTCLSREEFSKFSLLMTKEAVSRGFNTFTYPKLHLQGVCGAEKENFFVIAPDGLLFKCWAEASLGKSWSVGNIFSTTPTTEQKKNLLKYLDWDPMSDGRCTNCRILPICMGGCPHLRIHDITETDCSTWRYNLLETLAVRYKLSKKNNLTQKGGSR
jgi:uncharacterized protein